MSAPEAKPTMEQELKAPEHTTPTFETMPPEIRNQIYGCLLDGKVADTYEDLNGKVKPRFYTNILRVNKKTYREAHGILYAGNGPIVTVALYMTGAEEALKRGLVCFYETSFTRSIRGRQLHIVVKPLFLGPKMREPYVFVLVGMENIKGFYRFLKLLNWADNDGRGITYEFNFQPCGSVLEQAPTSSQATPQVASKVHRDLVILFMGLRASCQTVTTKGLNDRNVEGIFLSKLNDKIIWLYAETLELWNTSFEIYNEGSKLVRQGSLDAAIRTYENIVVCYTSSVESNPLLQSPDASLEGSFVCRLVTLITACQTSHAIINILGSFHDGYKGQLKKKATMDTLRRSLHGAEGMVAGVGGAVALMMIPKRINSAVWQIIALLRTICGCMAENIANAWGFAGDLADENDGERKALLYKYRDNASTIDWDALRASGGHNDVCFTTRIRLAKKYLDALPLPLIPYDDNKPFLSTSAINERSVLKRLGYTGPLYRREIRPMISRGTDPKTGECITINDKVDEARCKRVLDRIDEESAKHKKNYQFSVWITPEDFFFKGTSGYFRDLGIPTREIAQELPFENPRMYQAIWGYR
ncbi:hypothetical protein TWF481_002267 [Arthrobotrys musiformis]|uniref:Uncharacterized protein n=1 Tax=Arthrobotrys musiformis TaxID=47236 RepID=A0AAV9VSN8_9PEZI